MYFNKKNDRTGALFQGRFKSSHIDTDNYLKYLFSYIHLNPIEIFQSNWKEKGIADLARTKEYLNNFKFSSYLDFIGIDRFESKIISRKEFPAYFENQKNFSDFIDDWLTYSNSSRTVLDDKLT